MNSDCKLRIPADVPAKKDFWLVVVHDLRTCSQVQTGQLFPANKNNKRDNKKLDAVIFLPEASKKALWSCIGDFVKKELVGHIDMDEDGSVDCHFGPSAHQRTMRGHNCWIQTVPRKGRLACLSAPFGPVEPWFTKTWWPSKIEKGQCFVLMFL